MAERRIENCDCGLTGGCAHCNPLLYPATVAHFGQGQVPHKCPVCNGTGLVSVPPGIAGDQQTFTTSESGPWQCRVCLGAGVLEAF